MRSLYGLGESSTVTGKRGQCTGPSRHGMGIGYSEAARRGTLQGLGESEFNAQGLASAPRALATVKRPDEKLHTALERAAVQWLSEFNAQDLANTAWAYATVRRPDE